MALGDLIRAKAELGEAEVVLLDGAPVALLQQDLDLRRRQAGRRLEHLAELVLGAVEVGWDAVNGVPLRAAVYAQGSNTPVLELSATNVTFGNVPASDFAVSPPSNAKVVRVSQPSNTQTAGAKAKAKGAKRRARAAEKVRGSVEPWLQARSHRPRSVRHSR